MSGNRNACIQYSDADRQTDSGYAPCPALLDTNTNYPLSGSVVTRFADKLDAGLRGLASELPLTEGASGQFTFRLTTSPRENAGDADVTVTIARPAATTGVVIDTDNATPGSQNELTFTGDNWGTVQTVYVTTTADEDAVVPAALSISLTASGGGSGDYSYAGVSGSVTLRQSETDTAGLALAPTDLDVRRNGSAGFTVKLTSQPTAGVTVTLVQPAASTGVTADTDSGTTGNQTTLTFTTTDWNTAQTVTVSAAADAPLGDNAATISLAASGDAGEYAGVSGSVTIDVEERLPALVLTPGALTVDEGGSGTFTVRLNRQPSAAVTVTLTSNSADVNFTPMSLSFTATNWNTAQSVTVSAGQDTDDTHDSAGIALSAAGGDYAGVSGSVAVRITDDEAPRLTLTPGALSIDEGGSGSFTVRPSVAPTGNVTVTLRQPGNADVTVDADANAAGNQTELTFTTANWQSAQAVTVRAGHDDDEDNDSAVINLSASGANYSGVTGSVTVAVTDDDDAQLERERETVKLLLAEAIGGILSSTQEAIGLRWGAERTGRSATLAGRAVALDRSGLQELAAGFAGRAGDASQDDRYAEGRFGAERHSSDWLGGVALDAGRPLRSVAGRIPSGQSGRSNRLGGFSYALNPEIGRVTGWSVWGRTDTRGFSGGSPEEGEYEGTQNNFWVGLDHRGDGGALSGLAYSSSSSEADYTMAEGAGLLETDVSAVMPYIELAGENGATGRMLIGLGNGEATLTQTDRTQGSADLTMYLLALIGSWPAAEFGSSTLSWSGDVGFSALEPDDVPAAPALDGLRAERLRVRGGLQLMHDGFGASWTATPRLALMLRQDSGDGATGSGVELTAGMQVISTSGRLSIDVNVRSLLSHGAEGYSDSGSSLQLRMGTRTDGSGLAFSIGPHWGSAEGELLRGGVAPGARPGAGGRQGGRGVMADIGYGLRALGGLLTPYSEYRHTGGSGGGGIRQVAGVRFSGGDDLELRLFSERLLQRRGETRSSLAVELQRRY